MYSSLFCGWLCGGCCVGQLFFFSGWEALVGKGLRVAIDNEWGYLSSTVISYCAVTVGKGEKSTNSSVYVPHKRAIPRNSPLHGYQNIGNLSTL